MRLFSNQRGAAPIELVLGVGVLLFPVSIMVLTFPTWSERQSAARLAAQEAARVVVLADSWEQGVSDGEAMVSDMARRHGIDQDDLNVDFSGELARGETVTAEVTVRVPVARFPFFKTTPEVSWSVSHTELVDQYRSFPP